MADDEGELLLVRHGETEWSRAGRHTSSTEVTLTAAGERAAAALRPVLADRRIGTVLVSPRERARVTADLAGVGDRAVVEPDAVEWAYGAYEGLTTPQIRRDRPGWTIWSGDPPGGETAAAVGTRADRLLARIRPALADGDVLVVGHGHFGRVLAARYLGLPVRTGAVFRLDPATLCVLGTEHESPVVVRWNSPT